MDVRDFMEGEVTPFKSNKVIPFRDMIDLAWWKVLERLELWS